MSERQAYYHLGTVKLLPYIHSAVCTQHPVLLSLNSLGSKGYQSRQHTDPLSIATATTLSFWNSNTLSIWSSSAKDTRLELAKLQPSRTPSPTPSELRNIDLFAPLTSPPALGTRGMDIERSRGCGFSRPLSRLCMLYTAKLSDFYEKEVHLRRIQPVLTHPNAFLSKHLLLSRSSRLLCYLGAITARTVLTSHFHGCLHP